MNNVRMARCFGYGFAKIKENKAEHRFGCNYDCEKTLAAGGTRCKCERPSAGEQLPFFESKPDRPYDAFYCGCSGWD